MVPDDQQAAPDETAAPPASRHEVSWLQERRSVAVRRLGPPGPTDDEVRAILSAALAAPDHGALRPWRLVLCAPSSRQRLAAVFAAAKLAGRPDSTEAELAREREKALRPPVLVALIASPRPGLEKIPEFEQVASAGAALQSILLASYGLGYGAIMLSGERCAVDTVRAALGVGSGETLLGFISIGTIVDRPRLASRPSLSEVLSVLNGNRP